MMAAIERIRGDGPETIIVAVPTGSWTAVAAVSARVEETICLNLRKGYPYAVADAYRNWYDLSDEEVTNILSRAE